MAMDRNPPDPEEVLTVARYLSAAYVACRRARARNNNRRPQAGAAFAGGKALREGVNTRLGSMYEIPTLLAQPHFKLLFYLI